MARAATAPIRRRSFGIETPHEITTVFKHIAADVFAATDQRQRPELSLSAIGDFSCGSSGAGPDQVRAR